MVILKKYSLLFCLLLLVGCGKNLEETKSVKRPNVLLIVTDDQGWGDVGFHENKVINTPNLDKLAKESVEFNRFYVSPVCAPTRASLLTGKYHLSTGTSWVTHRKEVMRSEEITIAEIFKGQGYKTGLFGKWHNGKQYPHNPLGQGFATFFGFSDGHINNYFDAILESQYDKVATNGYVTDVLTDKAISFMTEDAPFFCYLSLNTPHSPFQLPDHLFNKYKNLGLDDKTSSVYGMVENIDWNIGKILEHLTITKQLDNTIVIFMTDNGPNGDRFNGGFKGIKAHVDEGGVRVPFLLKFDKKELNKGSIGEMAAHIDVLPTLADFCGINLPENLEIDGHSLVPLLNDSQKMPERKFFTHQVVYDLDTLPGAVRTEKYLLTLKKNSLALFDIQKDSLQQINIAKENPQVVDYLKKAYLNWYAESTAEGTQPEPIEVGHPFVPTIEVPAPDASHMQYVKFKGEMGWAHDYFIGWNQKSAVIWKIKAVEDQAYDVILQLSNTTKVKTVFELMVNEQRLKFSVEEVMEAPIIESPDRLPRGEVFEKKWMEINLGQVTIKKGLQDLELSVLETGPGQSSIEIKGIILKKV